ncbi:MAG: hypothetical protein IJF92_00685 [Bacilli bacterium]|nr:hypothetical protein [Bacilli bacterium]MBQ3307670.1 hypothetical protein [Bacilli bacterium]
MFKIINENGEALDTNIVDINSNDVIIIKANTNMSIEELVDIKQKVKDIFKDNKVLILNKNIELDIIKSSEDMIIKDESDNILNNIETKRKVLKG